MNRRSAPLVHWRLGILRAIKVQIRELLGPRPAELDRYYKRYKKIFYRPYRRIPLDEVWSLIPGKALVYIADYHTLPAAQAFQRRVLERLAAAGRPLRLYLEPFAHADQRALDDFLAGRMEPEEFLHRVRYRKTWGFDWKNYAPLLDFARERGLPVTAINLKDNATLDQRDRFAADLIAEGVRAHPEAVHGVIIGDLHLAPPHLPRRVNAALGRPVPSLVLYQNSETIYVKELLKGAAEGLVAVRLGPSAACVFNTPPWIKYESFLLYLHRSESLGGGEEGLDGEVQLVLSRLGALFGRRWEEEIQTATLDDLSFLPSLLNLEWAHPFLHLLQENYPFFLPRENLLYMPTPDLVRLSEALGHYIFYREGRWQRGHVFEPDRLPHRVFLYAFGFLTSKLVLEGRRTDSVEDLRRIAAGRTDARAETKLKRLKAAVPSILELHAALNRGEPGPARRAPLDRKDAALAYTLSRRTGYLLGEEWFQALKAGRLLPADLLSRLPGPDTRPAAVVQALLA
jgi:hypothetical protein